MEDVLKYLKGTCHYVLHSVQYEVFKKKLTSACFSKLHEKPYYYLLLNLTRSY